jgi:hypothetical protein
VKRSHFSLPVILVSITILLASCNWPGNGSPVVGDPSTPFIPPTLAVQSSPTPLATSTPTQVFPSPEPTATVECSDSLVFLEDETFPDGTVVAGGAEVEKIWLVANAGTCNWDERYRLRFASGSEMGAAAEQALVPARSGAEAHLRIVFTAPTEPGTYQSVWQAYSPNGEPFGDVVYIEIVVE